MKNRCSIDAAFLFLVPLILLSSVFTITLASDTFLVTTNDAIQQCPTQNITSIQEPTCDQPSIGFPIIGTTQQSIPVQTQKSILTTASSNTNFTQKWATAIGIYSNLQPLMHDVDGDGIMEIFLIGSTDGTPTGPAKLICLKGNTGAVVYQKKIDHGTGGATHRPLVIADAFNDGRYQIFYSGNGYGTNMTCIWATNGTMLWHTTLAGSQYHVFSVADTDKTGHPYVYVVMNGDANPPINGKIYKLWATNGSIKSQSRGYEYHCSNGGITIGDANFDGTYEIYVTDRYGLQLDGYRAKGLHCFNDDLQLLWNNSVSASSFNAILADVVPGNHQLEIVVGVQGANNVENSGIRIIYANGTTVPGKSSLDLDLSIHDQPALYDVDKDGHLEFFTCMGTPMKAWDLTSWSLDKNFGFISYCPPVIANVLGDTNKEVVSPSGSGVRIFDNGYHLVDTIPTPVITVIVQDIDADGYNEIITHEESQNKYYIKAYDTYAAALSVLADTTTPYYGNNRQNAECLLNWGNLPPVADFSYTIHKETVTLNASRSYDPDGYLTTWSWDFGDGQTGSGEHIIHMYRTSGLYNITLTTVDNDSASDHITKQVHVDNAPAYQIAFIFGTITNLASQGDSCTFTAVHTGVVTFSPLNFSTYTAGEVFTVSTNHIGFIGVQSILALCTIISQK